MIQIIRHWKDTNEAQLLHVEHSPIPYGLRAILILMKGGHSVFLQHQNRRMYCIGQKHHFFTLKTALHLTVKGTS